MEVDANAPSETKRRSSGSPVINWQGKAVALNVESKSSSASAFFLPLEQMVRHSSASSETGMLVVDSMVPGSPTYKHLEPGDVLVRVNKK
ncbi:Protease Do-like [Arachis hypogaea]|nr:Protease Do-like [Arachis hypogaea]